MRLIIILCLVSWPLAAQDNLREIENKAFSVGERLQFSIGWEFIDAGTAVLAVEDIQEWNGRPTYYVTATTMSNAFFSALYKVRNKLETFIDVEGIYPVRYVKKTSEGGTKRNFSVDFDHEAGTASIIDADSGNSVIPVPRFVQDIISAFYFVRTQPLESGKDIELSTFDNGRWKSVKINVVKREKISVDAGEYNCIVVRTPIGPFNNKSDLNIWLTDDDRRIPVLMKSKIAVGSVRAELEKVVP
jgi:hypothetical protein